jgi:hypothetical protein
VTTDLKGKVQYFAQSQNTQILSSRLVPGSLRMMWCHRISSMRGTCGAVVENFSPQSLLVAAAFSHRFHRIGYKLLTSDSG